MTPKKDDDDDDDDDCIRFRGSPEPNNNNRFVLGFFSANYRQRTANRRLFLTTYCCHIAIAKVYQNALRAREPNASRLLQDEKLTIET